MGQRYGFGVLAFLTGLIFYGTIRLWETRGSPTPFWDWQRYDWFSYLASWHDGPVVLNPQVPLFWFCVAIPLGGGFLALGQGHWKTLGPYGVWVGLQCWGALGSAQPFFHMLPAVAPLAFLCGHCTRGPHPSPWALANLLLGAVGALGLLCLPWAVSLGVAMPEPLLLLAAGFWKVPNPIPTWLVFASLCLVSAGYVAWSRGRVQLLYHCQLGLAAVVFGVLALAQYQHHWGVARVLDTLCPKGPLVTVGLLAPVWDWQGQQKGCSVVQRPRGALGSPPTTFAAVVPWWDGLNCPSLGFSSRIPLDPYVVCGGGQNPPPGGKTH